MRYVIDTQDTEGIIGIQIAKWAKERKIELIEKGEPLIELKAHLEKVAYALQLIKKSGYNQDVIVAYLKDYTGYGKADIRKMLEGQDQFYRAIGIMK